MLRQAMPRVPRNNVAKRAAEAARSRERRFMTAKQMMRPVSAGGPCWVMTADKTFSWQPAGAIHSLGLLAAAVQLVYTPCL
jgi:hypothetical protein